MYLLSAPKQNLLERTFLNLKKVITRFKSWDPAKKQKGYWVASAIDLFLILVILINSISPVAKLLSPLPSLHPLRAGKGGYEVFGFAPYFNFDKLDNINFDTLSTLAYFGVNVNPDGTLDQGSTGYDTFEGKQATELFQKAHNAGTRVVLTLTQMNQANILALMDDQKAQAEAIHEAVNAVTSRGIDGLNIDFEYGSNAGEDYTDKFSQFIAQLSAAMHQANPASRVTVSVYASAVKEPKIYDVSSLSKNSDGIFMMAYDFAVASSDNAIPTSPLYGYKTGQYWYDVSTAVSDFLTQMPSNKLILGVPYYGYNYSVDSPSVKAPTGWGGMAQSYSVALADDKPDSADPNSFKTGWDSLGEVGWIGYKDEWGDWRMIFLEDAKSLAIKYDFAKSKNLAGVGIWALGFDQGKSELWQVLSDKFGSKVADSNVLNKVINQVYADN